MPKLTSAQRKSRARKAAVTRCQNKCVASGGKKAGRKLSSSKRRAAKSRAGKQLGPWLAFLKKFRAENPHLGGPGTGSAMVVAAAKEYRKL